MTEEEKKAIEILKDNIGILEGKLTIKYTNYNTVKAYNTILKLIDKQQQEIEELKKENRRLKEFASAVFNEELNDKNIIHLTYKQYNAAIENAQNDINQKWIQKVKEINKGINSLMQSRKKWKYRYYKMKNKNKDLQKSVEQIYDDYQDIGKMDFDCLDKLEQKDKIIDLMAETINNYDIDEDICKQMGKNKNCNEFADKERCKICIKQYFKNKVKEG